MGLFKSKDERRIEREMKIKAHLRSIERSIRQQEKFADDFIKNAQHAQRIGDQQQYQFIRGALKKTAVVKRMLERQLLAMKNAMLISAQAQASQQFAESMAVMSKQIADVFSGSIRIPFGENIGDDLAGAVSRFALENDVAPWRQLSVIGNACADGENGFEFALGRTAAVHVARLHGAAGLQKIDDVGHLF